MTSSKTKRAEIRPAARKALAQLLTPLTGFVMDSGMSIQEFSALVRHAAVHCAAAKQLEVAKRINISGIAAATGISRADVSKILKAQGNAEAPLLDRHRQSTNKVLAVWNQDPRFTTPNGQPADLKIYGRGATFDSLVKSHGRGIPTRAMLDELLRMDAIELRAAQSVRFKTSLPIDKGVTLQVIKAFGDRVTQLMTTLLQNMRRPENALFVASVSGSKLPPASSAKFKAQIALHGARYLRLSEKIELVSKSVLKNISDFQDHNAVGVTVFVHETPECFVDSAKPRTNLKRS